MYIRKSWSTRNQTIYNHTDNHCEIMAIKSRPHWLPHEFSSTVSISCYTPFAGNSRLATTSTINTIAPHLKAMETKYPNALRPKSITYETQQLLPDNQETDLE